MTDDRRPGTSARAALIAALAGQFPAVLVVERWRPHRTLVVGVEKLMVAAGI